MLDRIFLQAWVHCFFSLFKKQPANSILNAVTNYVCDGL